MPIAIVLSLSFLFPWVVICCRRHSEEVSNNFFGWFFLLLFGFQTVAITPYLLYTFRFLTDWSTFYLFNPTTYPIITSQPLLLSALIVLAGYLLMIISYGYSRLTWNSGHVLFFQLPWLLSLGSIGTMAALYHERWLRVASYADYWNGAYEMVWLHPASWSIAGIILAAVITLWISFKLK